MKYTELIPLLAKAIQEQQAEIQALRAEVAALKRRPYPVSGAERASI